MLHRSRTLALATVFAILAVVTAASATTQTAPRNSVVSRSIKNGQVKTRDLAKKAVKAKDVKPDTLTGAQIDEATLDFAVLQARINGTCSSGQAVSAIGQDGSVTCAGTGGPPSGPAGGDLKGTYPDPTLADNVRLPQLCTSGQVAKSDGAGSWTCGTDQTGADWSLTGNAGTDPTANFVGTTDNQPLNFRVNNVRALRLQPGTNSPSLIGGSSVNNVTTNVSGATISGGGVGGLGNRVSDDYGTVGGGVDNVAGDDTGTLQDSQDATVGGGFLNTASGNVSTVGGGAQVLASAYGAVASGGTLNAATAANATVGGGYNNAADETFSTIAGGYNNATTGNYSAVPGGVANAASGYAAFAAGGSYNTASGNFSVAAGDNANATNDGSFVFADASGYPFGSAAANEFAARATGGVRFVTGIDGSGTPTTGVKVAAGGGSWSSLSDRHAKDHVRAISGRAVLRELARVPVHTWSYKSQSSSVRHMGPMAQTFRHVFGLGEDATHIDDVDAQGVALAALRGAASKLRAQHEALVRERIVNRRQNAHIAALERLARKRG